jgi:hypothetical protein
MKKRLTIALAVIGILIAGGLAFFGWRLIAVVNGLHGG